MNKDPKIVAKEKGFGALNKVVVGGTHFSRVKCEGITYVCCIST